MKVLLDGLMAGNQSGTGRYVEELCRGLQKEETRQIELKPFFPTHYDAERLGIPEDQIIRAHTDKVLGGTRYRNKHILKDIKSFEPDIIHYTATFGSQAKRRKWDESQVILTVHDLIFMRNEEWFKRSRVKLYKKLIKKSVEFADRIIADSCATADDLMLFLDVPQEKIDVIPLGVSEEFSPASEEEQTRVREKYHLPEQFYLYLGTLEPRKNIPRLIEAFSACAKRVPLDLVIAGREGWKVKPIHKAFHSSKYKERIHFPGFIPQEDVSALMSAAHIFVWPSLYEGFGLPPLESMACGTPVLTSNVSSMPEMLEHSALTLDPFDIDSLAKGMRMLYEDESRYMSMQNSGFNRFKRFPWSQTVDLTLDSYNRVLRDL